MNPYLSPQLSNHTRSIWKVIHDIYELISCEEPWEKSPSFCVKCVFWFIYYWWISILFAWQHIQLEPWKIKLNGQWWIFKDLARNMVYIEKYKLGDIQGEIIKNKNNSVGVDFLLALWCLAEFCPSDDWRTHAHTHSSGVDKSHVQALWDWLSRVLGL